LLAEEPVDFHWDLKCSPGEHALKMSLEQT
jgi:hypothetical protein